MKEWEKFRKVLPVSLFYLKLENDMFGEMARMLWLRNSLRMLSKSSNSDAGRKDNLLLLRSRLSRLRSKPLKAPGFRFPIRQLAKSSSLTPVSKNPWSWTVWMGLFRRLVKLIHLKFWKEFFVITLMEFSFRINLSSFNFIFEKPSSMFSILLLDKSRVFSDFMLEMAIKGIFPRRLLARSSCDRTGTPFWKAIEWIFMMLLRLRSSLNNCFRFQNTPTLTLDNHQPEKLNEKMLQLREENIKTLSKKECFYCPVVSHLLPSGTDVRELPAKIRVLRELERLLRSNCSMSEMWLSTTNKELINYHSHTITDKSPIQCSVF